MRQFFITMAGTIAGIFGFFILLIVIFMFFGLLGALSSVGEKTPDKVLTLDLRTPMIDHSIGESLFGERQKSVVDTVYGRGIAPRLIRFQNLRKICHRPRPRF